MQSGMANDTGADIMQAAGTQCLEQSRLVRRPWHEDCGTNIALHACTGNAEPRISMCAVCAHGARCMPPGLDDAERREFSALIQPHRRLAAGDPLYHAGDDFTHLYLVKTGAFKTVVMLPDGREQITGFHFAGDTLGIDALASTQHPSEAIALEDATLCALPHAPLAQLARRRERVQRHVERLLAREVVRDQGVMLLLGRMTADERVAVFLRGLAARFRSRGLSATEFHLPMAREDIGNYLGLTLETVSRALSKLRKTGVLAVDGKHIRILDADRLQAIANH
jgi:CRP/FNR family transcriptional regulator